MSLTPWSSRSASGNGQSEQRNLNSALDQDISSTLRWSSEVFEISDLQVQKSRDGIFLTTLLLDGAEAEKSGSHPIPAPQTHLSLKVEGKEIPLLSGFLNRQLLIRKLEYHRLVSQKKMEQEISELRAENQNLQTEVQNLYGALERLQRTRSVA